jgi:Domain of unknown function DUF29
VSPVAIELKLLDEDQPRVFAEAEEFNEYFAQADKRKIEYLRVRDVSGVSTSRAGASADLTVTQPELEPRATPEAGSGVSRMATTLYDTDFDAWAQHQAHALRAQAWDELDLDHLIEEIEDLPQTRRTIVRSQFRILVGHLLKLAYQPERQGESWQTSVRNARVEIDEQLADWPSLRQELPALLASAYPKARRLAIKQTGLAPRTFPSHCQWSPEQLLDEDFWP